MWQVAQKPRRKFCGQKTAKKSKTHPVWAEKGETGCVSGAGEGCSRCRRVRKPKIRTKMNHIAMQHMKKGNRRKPSVFAGFLAGAEGLEPSARGFGVDVGKCSKEQGRAGVARFLPQVRKGAVLVWCWEEIIRAKTGEKERKIPGKAGNTLTEIDNVRIIKNAGETRRASVADRRLATPFYSTQRGGDTYGKQPRGESSALCNMLGHRLGAGHSVCPKSVLTARLASERST